MRWFHPIWYSKVPLLQIYRSWCKRTSHWAYFSHSYNRFTPAKQNSDWDNQLSEAREQPTMLEFSIIYSRDMGEQNNHHHCVIVPTSSFSEHSTTSLAHSSVLRSHTYANQKTNHIRPFPLNDTCQHPFSLPSISQPTLWSCCWHPIPIMCTNSNSLPTLSWPPVYPLFLLAWLSVRVHSIFLTTIHTQTLFQAKSLTQVTLTHTTSSSTHTRNHIFTWIFISPVILLADCGVLVRQPSCSWIVKQHGRTTPSELITVIPPLLVLHFFMLSFILTFSES